MKAARTLIALTALLLPATVLAADFPPEHLGVEASVEPAGDGTYTCSARISDLESGELVAAPKLKFRSGEEAVVTSGDESALLEMRVTARQDDSTATVEISVVRDGTKQTIHRLQLRL